MKKIYRDALEVSPIIAAVKDDDGLHACLDSETQIIFILYGDVMTIPDIVDTVKSGGKLAFVDIDLIQGLSAKEAAAEYIARRTKADGVISTKAAPLQKAKELSLCTVLRCFVIDSMAYRNIDKQLQNIRPDILEVLPGPMPNVIQKIYEMFRYPMIASGLISRKEEVVALLNTGIDAVSTTNQSLWFQ